MNRKLLQATTGLNTKIDRVRLPLRSDRDNAVYPMSEVMNCWVEDSGRPERVPGYALIVAGNFRDFFCQGQEALVVKDNNLCLFHSSGALTVLAPVTPPLPVGYVQTEGGRIYWSNGLDAGYVESGVNHAWVVDSDEYALCMADFANASISPTPPYGKVMEEHEGRIYVATGRAVWMSERFLPTIFRPIKMIPFGSDVRLIASVDDGLWVADGKSIYFLAGDGTDPEDRRLPKATAKVTPGCYCKVDAKLLNVDGLNGTGHVVKVWTDQGLFLCGPGGFIASETRDVLETAKNPYPLNVQSGAVVEWQGALIATFTG
jgi:hypothetical protein